MGAGYKAPVPDEDVLRSMLSEISRRLREIEAMSGTQLADAVARIQELVDGILEQTEVNVTGDGNFGGTVTADTGMTSVGVYNLDVSTLAGGRRSSWVHESGRIGYAPSTITKKANLKDFPAPASAFLASAPLVFQYKALLDIRDNPDNPMYDPNLEVPYEPGLIAEWLVDAGLDMFVFRDEQGDPAGINYGYFAAVGLVVVGRAQQKQIEDMAARLDDAGL